MLKGLALTPPIVGRISIGKVVERDGRRLPEKDDEFTITSQVQSREGWVAHPLNESLRQIQPGTKERSAKLRSIPVRLVFDDPALSLRSAYTLFDRKSGRPLCVGDGESCRRSTRTGVQSLPCPAPESCELARDGCKPFGRLNVRIDSPGDGDELGSFVFRTAGFNSIRTLATRLLYLHAASGGKLSTLPLEIRLRGKSTAQSHRAPIYYVDLTLRSGLTLAEAVSQAQAEWGMRRASGFDQVALDEAARSGLAQGAFEDSSEDSAAIVEELYPEDSGMVPAAGRSLGAALPALVDKLVAKLETP